MDFTTIGYCCCRDCFEYTISLINNDFTGYDFYFSHDLLDNESAEREIERMSNIFNDEFAHLPEIIFNIPEHETEQFSRAACEICNSRLGGTRHLITVSYRKDAHMQNCESLIEDLRMDMLKHCESLLEHGHVNLGEYDPQEFALAKLLVTSALYAVKDDYVNPHDPGFMRKVNKLYGR